jgi:hypothetical protein
MIIVLVIILKRIYPNRFPLKMFSKCINGLFKYEPLVIDIFSRIYLKIKEIK